MEEFHTSLLREKFVLHDPNFDLSNKAPVIALSNRMVIDLKKDKKSAPETIIIRAQNMHLCVRMAARIVQEFSQRGPITNRKNKFEWDKAWKSLVNDYEAAFNPDLWISIYHKGKVIFESGKRHPLLDVIEKCDATNDGDYNDSIPIAEDAFKKTGKVIKIEYDGNVALVVNLEKLVGRCGIILRSAHKTTTFNFSASAKPNFPLNFAQCMSVAAGFLEGIQMSFMVGIGNVHIQRGIIEKHSTKEKKQREAIKRLKRLDAEITNFENSFMVNYRPEKPIFKLIVADSEKLAEKSLDDN